MSIGQIIKKALRLPADSPSRSAPLPPPKRRCERDIYFTAQFHAKAEKWGLTENHARLVFWEGDVVKQFGKPTNTKVLQYKGQEIGIYVFRDEQTNQPVTTLTHKRQTRSVMPERSR